MSHHSRIARAIAAHGHAIGTSLSIPDPTVLQAAAEAGLDFVQVDGEHRELALSTLERLAVAAALHDVTLVARVPDDRPSTLAHTLATGVSGVLVPRVEDAAQARAIVEATYYPPLGRRSVGGGSPLNEADPVTGADEVERGNARTLLWIIVESVRGVENLAEILRVPGVDAVLPGPFDLSAELGVPGQTAHPEVRRLLATIRAVARDAGVDVVGSDTTEGATGARAAGSRILLAAADRRVLLEGFRAHVGRIQEDLRAVR